jgi:hypothetical protein
MRPQVRPLVVPLTFDLTTTDRLCARHDAGRSVLEEGVTGPVGTDTLELEICFANCPLCFSLVTHWWQLHSIYRLCFHVSLNPSAVAVPLECNELIQSHHD